tara:strand:+ start:351 stop:638 length:288 start_codon:yes stop_codon:yes gene_type:complete
MPRYDFKCNECEHVFELDLPMTKSASASKKPCPECGKKAVHRLFNYQAGAVDYNRKPGQDYNELMDKMKRGVPKRFHEKLDKSKETRGGNLGKTS